MNETLLIVDDEAHIVRSLSRVLKSAGYRVFTAESGEDALNVLGSNQIDLLITDVKMSSMDGYQLLKAVKDKYPSVIRLVLSGYYDESMLLKIQQSSLAKLYLFKPWSNQELLQNISGVLSTEKLLRDKRLFEVINKIDLLPSPDGINKKFNQLVDQNAGMDEISAVIESDQSTAAKVIQIANSAFYGARTGSVRKVLTYLGLSNVRNILLAISLNNGFGRMAHQTLAADFAVISRHTALTNQILCWLYQRLFNKKIPDTCATAGLLHDIGKVVILSNFPEEYLKALKAVNHQSEPYKYYEETEALAVSHSELGGYLLGWWEMPHSIVEAALYHHNPLDDRIVDRELVALVYLSGQYSWNIVLRREAPDINEDVLRFLSLTQDGSSALLNELRQMELG